MQENEKTPLLFPDVATLQASGYIFRITDNGGASYDRFTIVMCDGDYFGSCETPGHPQGFFQSGEGLDVQRLSECVESGEERDLRWIDLPAAVQRAVIGRLNLDFEWAIEQADSALHRGAVDRMFDGSQIGGGIYRIPGGYAIADENSYQPGGTYDGGEDAGPFASYRDALFYTLPDEYQLSGPEYHGTVDLWGTDGGPAELWICPESESAS